LFDATDWVEHATTSLGKPYLAFRAFATQRFDRNAQLLRGFGFGQLLHEP
jgi:hypothetical protein